MECVCTHIQEVPVTYLGGTSEGHDAQQIALRLICARRIVFKVGEETPSWAIVLSSLREDDFSKKQPLRANKHNSPDQNKKHTREKGYSHQPTPNNRPATAFRPITRPRWDEPLRCREDVGPFPDRIREVSYRGGMKRSES
jgi:hypothetical protein